MPQNMVIILMIMMSCDLQKGPTPEPTVPTGWDLGVRENDTIGNDNFQRN
jgi:hypothetical protein